MDRKLLTLGLALAGTAAQAQDHPNIVLFLVDDMGVMDTSVPFLTDGKGNPVRYPLNDWYRTPNMERLAHQGVRFSQFYAQGVSSPSRASLLTGQDAARHRVTNWIRSEGNNRDDYGPYDWNWEGLGADDITLPPAYTEDGYLLWGILQGGEDPWHEDTFLNHFPHQHRGSYFTSWRHGDWKLIYYYNPAHPDYPQCTLFNLKEDPSESQDVLRKHPRIARRLLREMIDRLRRDNATYPVDFEGKPVLPREDAIR